MLLKIPKAKQEGGDFVVIEARMVVTTITEKISLDGHLLEFIQTFLVCYMVLCVSQLCCISVGAIANQNTVVFSRV